MQAAFLTSLGVHAFVWVWDESVFAAEDDLAPLQSVQDAIWLSRCDS